MIRQLITIDFSTMDPMPDMKYVKLLVFFFRDFFSYKKMCIVQTNFTSCIIGSDCLPLVNEVL